MSCDFTELVLFYKTRSNMLLHIFLIISLSVEFVKSSYAQTHCFCNSPGCASSNYMCYSKYGCYSELRGKDEDESHLMHGCVDDVTMVGKCLVAEEIVFKRLNQSLHSNEKEAIPAPTLTCCYEDMCNYVNDKGDALPQEFHRDDDEESPDFNSLTSSAVWFRAAVIAVPIAGFCILILLAMLASHLLSSDINKHTFSRLNEQKTPSISNRRTYHSHYNQSHRQINKYPQLAQHVKKYNRTYHDSPHGAHGIDIYMEPHHKKESHILFNEIDKLSTLPLTKDDSPKNCYTYLPSGVPLKIFTQSDKPITLPVNFKHSKNIDIV